MSPLASPREALGSLQAATAALLGFKFMLERYGDPAHTHTVYKPSCNMKNGFDTEFANKKKTKKGERVPEQVLLGEGVLPEALFLLVL